MAALIQVEQVSKYFGQLKAVDSLSLNVKRGEVVGFLGPNGAGKSTTIKMITGFLTPDAGSVFIDGQNIEHAPILSKAKIGYLPEGAPLYPEMRVYDFLYFIAGIRGIKKHQRAAKIKWIAKKVNIGAVLGKPIETLSKGFRRRVGLAQAILHDPDILILDEPTDGLDPNQKHEMRALISELSRHKAILISTHILEEVEALCDRIIVIAGGKVVADATTSHLLSENKTPHIEVVLSGVQDEHFALEIDEMPSVDRFEIISRTEAFTELRLFCQQTDAPVKAISEIARKNAWKIEALSTQQGRLDIIFRDITQNIQKIS